MQAIEVSDFASWRAGSRNLLARSIGPERVTWMDRHDEMLPLALSTQSETAADIVPDTAGSISRQLLKLLEACSCHRDSRRWALMYRIVWRINHGERHLLEMAADADVRTLTAMVKAVDQACHKMKAFVRFRETADAAGEPRYVAWFEPAHRVLQRVAPFFADRFGSMHWTIVTPDGAAQWDRSELLFLDDASAVALPASDDKEALWRAYYASIFNPARLNAAALQRQMPKRYWSNLPEALDIAQLETSARQRVDRMLKTAPADVDRWQGFADQRVKPLRYQTDSALTQSVRQCTRCALWRQATQAVCGAGPASAAIMLVGEQPGDEEDLKGQPFVGPAGRLLDRALAAAELDQGQRLRH